MSKLLGRIVLVTLLAAVPCAAQEIVLDKMLVLDRVGRAGRTPVFVDPVEHARVTGTWKAPKPGDVVTSADGHEVPWREATAGADGWITGGSLAGGYALATVEASSERVMILEASGHGMVFVNREPRAGDPYGHGYVRLPVLLKKGTNELLFTIARGRVRAKLTPPKGDVYPDTADVTSPDFMEGRAETAPFAVPFVNATTRPVSEPARILPLTIRKVRLSARYEGRGPPPKDEATSVEFRVRQLGQTFKRTFISDIDGSVQYYAVNAGVEWQPHGAQRGLVLSLHGAAVEATNQADAYSPKKDLYIVCPTNRRPYGFDWEDWGRLDALEVLADAGHQLTPDASRIYLTGHSMGGHGAWSIGSLFPDRFAAVGPSAGWISFATYSSTRPTTQTGSAVAELMRRAALPSDTGAVFPNLAHLGVYILHGAVDDNVPAKQARQMVEHLKEFHKDFVYHEQPGAGHWWESSAEPGAECVDWPPMFDFFARHRQPGARELRGLAFVTPSPGVSARCHWVEIQAQQRAMRPSSVRIRVDPGKRRYAGETTNVERLRITMVHLDGVDPVHFELDGQQIKDVEWPDDRTVWLERGPDGWRVTAKPQAAAKGPHRNGPFKDAFRNQMMFVYGTRGTAEENAWAIAKARFDAETFWYRGNGSIDVIPDTEFDATRDPHRNVIVYGNADTVSCWDALLRDSPVQIRRGRVTIGNRTVEGADLACLFLRPRPGSERACVAVIGGSGVVGMRVTDRLPIFLSGVAYPDVTLLSPRAFQQGLDGVRGAGFFGNDWSVERGEFYFDEQGPR